MKIRCCTPDTVRRIKEGVPFNLDWYSSPDDPFPFREYGGTLDAKIEVRDFQGGLEREGASLLDAEVSNSLKVHEAMSSLTPHQACIEGMWVYLCHTECAKYVRDRWLGSNQLANKDRKRTVLAHFFADGPRGLMRQNGISRLWWLGHLAKLTFPESPETFLRAVLKYQDVRAAVLERPTLSRNPKTARCIVEVMLEHSGPEKSLLQRSNCRSWMQALTRMNRTTHFDALSPEQLAIILREEAVKVLS